MRNKPDTLSSASRAARVLLGVLLLAAASANAEIRFENKSDEPEDRGARFALDVRNEPIAKVMDALAERYDFSVDGYPEHWSDDPMSFSATGDLERVLRALLKDTSHVFEYHTDLETRETRIARLNLLNEGVAGFVATSPVQSADPAMGPKRSNRKRGSLADRANPDRLNGYPGAAEPLDIETEQQPRTRPAPTQVSGISSTLEQRARLSGGLSPKPNSNPSSSTNSAAADVEAGVPNADMQALTQKALQDVRGLADALKSAESSR